MARRLTKQQREEREYFQNARQWGRKHARAVRDVEKALRRIPHTKAREGAYDVYTYTQGQIRILAESPYAEHVAVAC